MDVTNVTLIKIYASIVTRMLPMSVKHLLAVIIKYQILIALSLIVQHVEINHTVKHVILIILSMYQQGNVNIKEIRPLHLFPLQLLHLLILKINSN